MLIVRKPYVRSKQPQPELGHSSLSVSPSSPESPLSGPSHHLALEDLWLEMLGIQASKTFTVLNRCSTTELWLFPARGIKKSGGARPYLEQLCRLHPLSVKALAREVAFPGHGRPACLHAEGCVPSKPQPLLKGRFTDSSPQALFHGEGKCVFPEAGNKEKQLMFLLPWSKGN